LSTGPFTALGPPPHLLAFDDAENRLFEASCEGSLVDIDPHTLQPHRRASLAHHGRHHLLHRLGALFVGTALLCLCDEGLHRILDPHGQIRLGMGLVDLNDHLQQFGRINSR